MSDHFWLLINSCSKASASLLSAKIKALQSSRPCDWSYFQGPFNSINITKAIKKRYATSYNPNLDLVSKSDFSSFHVWASIIGLEGQDDIYIFSDIPSTKKEIALFDYESWKDVPRRVVWIYSNEIDICEHWSFLHGFNQMLKKRGGYVGCDLAPLSVKMEDRLLNYNGQTLHLSISHQLQGDSLEDLLVSGLQLQVHTSHDYEIVKDLGLKEGSLGLFYIPISDAPAHPQTPVRRPKTPKKATPFALKTISEVSEGAPLSFSQISTTFIDAYNLVLSCRAHFRGFIEISVATLYDSLNKLEGDEESELDMVSKVLQFYRDQCLLAHADLMRKYNERESSSSDALTSGHGTENEAPGHETVLVASTKSLPFRVAGSQAPAQILREYFF